MKRIEALIALAMGRAASGVAAFTAAANNFTAVAAATGAAAPPVYVAIAAPAGIPKKASGKYLVVGAVTIDKNAGSLLDGDAVTLQPFANGVEVGTGQFQGGAVTSGATVQAIIPFALIMSIAGGGPNTIDMRVTAVTTAHTSAVLVNNGWISVIELPA